MKRREYTEYEILEMVKKKYEEAPEPPIDKEETWKMIRNSMRTSATAKSRTAFRVNYRLALPVLLCVVIVGVFAFPNSKGYTMKWLSQYFMIAKEHTLQIMGFNNRTEPKGIPGIAKVEEISITEELPLGEAVARSPFDIVIPNLAGMQLESAKIKYTNSNKDVSVLSLLYTWQGKTVTINEEYNKDRRINSKTVDTEDSVVKQLDINGLQGTLLNFKNGINQVEILYADTKITIRGELSGEELTQIAYSLQKYWPDTKN